MFFFYCTSKFIETLKPALKPCLCGRGCSTVEHQVSAQADLLSSSASSLVSSLCLTADESRQSLEEMSGCCSHIHSSVTGTNSSSPLLLLAVIPHPQHAQCVCVPAGLLARDLEWSSRVKEHAEKRAEEHLTLMRKVGSEAQDLRQVRIRGFLS